tara:strand:+ start:262 stop:531 length:270 start_codon:yes stop_codon:yes gene_type:complete
MLSYEESDILREKIAFLEQQIVDLQDATMSLTEGVRDMQRFVIQLSHNQILIAKQVAQWPYVLIEDPNPKKRRKTSNKPNSKEPPDQQD